MSARGTTVDRGTNDVPHPPYIVASQSAVKKPILNEGAFSIRLLFCALCVVAVNTVFSARSVDSSAKR